AFAGSNNSTGGQNTCVGRSSGAGNQFGNRNTFIGASSSLVSGDSIDRAIAIGYNAKVGCSNCAVVGGTGMDSVSVGIGISNPTQVLDVNGNAKFRHVPNLAPLNSAFPLYIENDGTLYQYISFSDRRLKDDIKPLKNVLNKLDGIHGYSYYLRNNPNQTEEIGVIAQEIEKEFPQLVFRHEGYMGVNYERLSAILLQAVKEQQVLIMELQHKVELILSQQ
ncbi:MAG: tail fiber domain-containing protein, partial [Saprospiraceae bacterium]|nr:tail fiber domain-containing protein [Saprospiraceae bacterium]